MGSMKKAIRWLFASKGPSGCATPSTSPVWGGRRGNGRHRIDCCGPPVKEDQRQVERHPQKVEASVRVRPEASVSVAQIEPSSSAPLD